MLLTTTKTRFNNSILAGIPQTGTEECTNVELFFDENGVCTNDLDETVQQAVSTIVPDLEYVFVEGEPAAPVDSIPPVDPTPPVVEPAIPEIPVVKTIEQQKAETRAELEKLDLEQLRGIASQSGMNKNAVNKATKAGIVEYLVAKVQ